MNNVLITGASGFLASWVMRSLLQQGASVTAVDIKADPSRLRSMVGAEQAERVTWYEGDLSDAAQFDELIVKAKPDTVVHMAALQIPACQANPGLGARINLEGHINVFESARKHGIKRLIYTSSAAAKPRGEARAPANFYGVFKRAGEEVARLYWERDGISSLGLRPYIVYGYGRDQGETSVFTSAIAAAARGEAYTLPFCTSSCLQYAGEVADIFARCCSAEWDGAIVSDLSSQLESTEDLIAAITAAEPDAQISCADKQRSGPDSDFEVEPLRKIIGRWPSIDLRSGVAETLNMYREV